MTLSLFSRYEIGPYTLKNRMVMAPLTRSRSKQPGNIPWPAELPFTTLSARVRA